MVSSYVESYGIESIPIFRNIVQIYEGEFRISSASQYSIGRKLCSCSSSYWSVSCLSAACWLLERSLQCNNNFKWRISPFETSICKTRFHIWWFACSTTKFMRTVYPHYLLRSISQRGPRKIRQTRNGYRSPENIDGSLVKFSKTLTQSIWSALCSINNKS